MKFPVITLCGSSKFKDDFIRIAEKLTLSGNIVLMPSIFSHSDHTNQIDQKTECLLYDIHREKIRMSDKIIIINRDDYIGQTTEMEICYASEIGIPIEYAFPHNSMTNLIVQVDSISFHKF